MCQIISVLKLMFNSLGGSDLILGQNISFVPVGNYTEREKSVFKRQVVQDDSNLVEGVDVS